jgi:hypothetical protein
VVRVLWAISKGSRRRRVGRRVREKAKIGTKLPKLLDTAIAAALALA